MFKSQYVLKVYQKLLSKNNSESEFIQAVTKFLYAIEDFVINNNYVEEYGILERIIEPDRLIIFSVPWVNDSGKVEVNRGFRVQYNNSIGPYKGGLRFNPSVNSSIIKFLGFSQTLKNAITTQPLGGGKGGSDFDPKGKSDLEIMRFCQSFMNELYRHIGPYTDVPAGDLGVGAKEVGFLYGQYKKITNTNTGVLTGKDYYNGGILGRPEATGYGLCFYTNYMLKVLKNDSFKNKSVIISGCGNVGLFTFEKTLELGGKVVGISDTSGCLLNQNGLDYKLVKTIKESKQPLSSYINTYAEATFSKNVKDLFKVNCDICLPCATQNEIDLEDAITLVANGCYCISEGANMPLTNESIDYIIKNNVLYGPSIASNCGGVMVSGFEMSQNSDFIRWDKSKVFSLLQKNMEYIFTMVNETSLENNLGIDFSKASSIYAFKIVSQAMKTLGI